MPQLRSGVRRGRRRAIEPEEENNNNNVNDNKRITRRNTAAKNTRQRGGAGKIVGGRNSNKNKEVVPVVDEIAVKKTAIDIADKDKEVEKAKEEEVGEKEMDEYDSGGQSGDKGLGAEDEGSTAPLPERVSFSLINLSALNNLCLKVR